MRSSIFAILCLISAGCILAGCAVKEETPPEPRVLRGDNMEISIDFRKVHLCSRISPEITVAYAPQGTRFYDVRLIERSSPEIFLGGGRRDEDGSGLIPEGALTRQYTGPCPPGDSEAEYAYIVSAMSVENGQPLEVLTYPVRIKPGDKIYLNDKPVGPGQESLPAVQVN